MMQDAPNTKYTPFSSARLQLSGGNLQLATHTHQPSIAAAIERISLPVQMVTAHLTVKDKLQNNYEMQLM